jgi:hypothetical protein
MQLGGGGIRWGGALWFGWFFVRFALFGCRGQLGGLVTFLASPRKVTQRRRHPSTAPAGFPALLTEPGGCATRPSRAHKPCPAAELKQCSPTTPGPVALLGGESRGIQTKHPIPILAFPLKGKEPQQPHNTRPPLPNGERAGVRGSRANPRPQNPNSPSAPPRFSG